MRRRNDVALSVLTALLLLLLVRFSPTAEAQNSTDPIPEDRSEVENWFEANVRSYTDPNRTETLDRALAAAESAAGVITVKQDGTGDFRTVSDAIASIPDSSPNRTVVSIGAGVYTEKIVVNASKPFVTLYGSPDNTPTLIFNGTAAQFGTVDSATLIVESDYFMAVNLIIANSSPRPGRNGSQAVAMRISGDKAAFYNCSFTGFQDTLCDDLGKHFFKDCYIEGTVDFVFGNGKSIYLNTELYVKEKHGPSVITAQGRDSDTEDSGYSFVHCSIDGNTTDAYLGRAWMRRPIVVFSYTAMSAVVDPAGWSDNLHPDRDESVFYGEYGCMGPGSSLEKRAKFARALTFEEAEPFLNLGYINGTDWLLPPPTL